MKDIDIARELVAVAKELEASKMKTAGLPIGYFLVTSDFRITPGGGWSITFRKGGVLRSEEGHLFRYNAKAGDWREVRPPISGRGGLDIDHYGTGNAKYNMYKSFVDGTKKITKKEATRLTEQSEQRMTIKVSDFKKIVDNLGLKARDEVVLIVPPKR